MDLPITVATKHSDRAGVGRVGRRRPLIFGLAIAVLGVAVGGCSGGGKASPSATPSTGAVRSTVKATGGGAFCTNEADAVNAGTLFDPAKATGSDALRKLVASGRQQNNKIEASAPAEVKDDVIVVNRGTETIFAAFEQANYDVTKLQLGALTAVAADPQFTTSANRIATYIKQHCGFELPAPPPAPTTTPTT